MYAVSVAVAVRMKSGIVPSLYVIPPSAAPIPPQAKRRMLDTLAKAWEGYA